MTQFAQQADANFTPAQIVGNALPTITVIGANAPGAGWYPIPMMRLFGFVFQNAAAVNSTFTIFPAVALGFCYVSKMMLRFSATTEIRISIGGTVIVDYDFEAGTPHFIDFGTPGFTTSTVNAALTVSNPFAITDIRVNAWGSMHNA